MSGKVLWSTKTKTDYKVEIEAGPGPKDGQIEHILVEDILKFAKELERAEAPTNESVRMVKATNDGYLIKSLGVYWSEDLINGEPAAEADHG